MLKIFGVDYTEQLEWQKGDIKYGRGRIKIATILMLSLITSSIVMIGLSLGTWLYIFPIFIAIQLISSVVHLVTFRENYLRRDNVREIGFVSTNGEFIGSDYEQRLYLLVLEMSDKLDLKIPPKVVIEETEVINAYAIGSSRNKGLIVVTTGLIEALSEKSVHVVVAHEMAHIVNGDMVGKMVLNSLSIVTTTLLGIPVRMLTWPITVMIEERLDIDNISSAIYIFFNFVIDYVILSLFNLVTLAYSRRREFRADLLAAKIIGAKEFSNMVDEFQNVEQDNVEQLQYATLGFNGITRFMEIFSTHPSWRRRKRFVERRLKYV